jgi:hypothetical protein
MRAGLQVFAAVAVAVAVASTAASADHYPRGATHLTPAPTVLTVQRYGSPVRETRRRTYDWCDARASRLREFEHRVRLDGRVSEDELRIAAALRADLAGTCGPRWRKGGVRLMR